MCPSRGNSGWQSRLFLRPRRRASRPKPSPPSRRARDMELKVPTLEGKESGTVNLSDEIFGLKPRQDLIQRYIVWQLAKRRAGTHDVKNRAEIWRTGKKLSRQKGGGTARHGSPPPHRFGAGGRAVAAPA